MVGQGHTPAGAVQPQDMAHARVGAKVARAALALWLAHVLIDQKGWPAWGRRFGVNAITAYLGASVMSVALLATGAWGWVWQQLAAAMPGALELASMLQALAFVTLWWGVAWWLDRRRIYLKI